MQQQKVEHPFKYHFWSTLALFHSYYILFWKENTRKPPKTPVKTWFLCQWQPCKWKCARKLLAFRSCDGQYRPRETMFMLLSRYPHLKQVNILDVLHHGWGKQLFWLPPGGIKYRSIRSNLIGFFHIYNLTRFLEGVSGQEGGATPRKDIRRREGRAGWDNNNTQQKATDPRFRRGHCPRLELHHLIIRTHPTDWWPVSHTHARAHRFLV